MSVQKQRQVNQSEQSELTKLSNWFLSHNRELPWRENPPNPYRVWLGETMSQQTTMVVVKTYFAKFTEAFPQVEVLAEASEAKVLAAWAGLGYYSRAKNLHRAAQRIKKSGFPRSYLDWLELPGVGPYTAAAVASICYKEKVGVVDGNVIRVISRYLGKEIKHWTSGGREEIQQTMNHWVQMGDPAIVNQAVMELGQFVCTRESPLCSECPLAQTCRAKKMKTQNQLPPKKPRRVVEHWLWQIDYLQEGNKVFLVKNQGQLPVLKNTWIFPGRAKKLNQKPSNGKALHSITHHSWYVEIEKKKSAHSLGVGKWFSINDLSEVNPSQFLKKIVRQAKN